MSSQLAKQAALAGTSEKVKYLNVRNGEYLKMFQFRAIADHMTNPGEVEPTILMMNNGDGYLVKIMTTVDRALPWTSLPDSIREL